MKQSLRAILSVLILVVTAYSGLLAADAESRELETLSEKAAKKFLSDVRASNVAEFSFQCKFDLVTSKVKGLKKSGDLLGSGADKYKIIFDNDIFQLDGANFFINGVECSNGLNDPFFDELVFSPADLQFIFIGADKYFYLGAARISGRSVQQFACRKEISIDGEQISYIKVSIDEKFKIVLQIDFLRSDKKPIRRISVSSFKDFEGTWFPRAINFSNFPKHQRSKLEVNSFEIIK